MAYVSLYRKWRPQDFSDVVGQTHIVRTLENSLNLKRISHAYLFAGPRGTGKTTLARLFAKGLNCSGGPIAQFCGECPECMSITKGNSLNVIEIDGASNRGIDEIRELREQVRYAPASARYKIYIIDEVHMLTSEAFNALLKTLEEPPPHVIFIIATTDPQKIPATILSRCQRYDFKRFSVEEICNRLRVVLSAEGVQAEKDALEIVAAHAQGGMRDALGILDQCLAYSDRLNPDIVGEILGVATQETIVRFFKMVSEHNTIAVFQLINDLYVRGRDLAQFVRDLLQYLRWCILDSTILTQDELNWDKAQLIQTVEVFSQCEKEMRYANNLNIPLELAVLRLIEIPTEWTKLQKRIEQLEGQLASIEKSGVSPNSSKAQSESPRRAEDSPRVKLNSNEDNQAKLQEICNNWQDYLKLLRDERLIQPEAFLREGLPVLLENNVLTVSFQKERGFHRASIEQEKHREPAERYLSKFFGTQLSIQCVTGEISKVKKEEIPREKQEFLKKSGSNQPIEQQENVAIEKSEELDESVSAALRIFGGKVIEIKDQQ